MDTVNVVIAGGSSPSGIAAAAAFAGAGHRVFTVGSDASRITTAADTARASLTSDAGTITALVADLSDPASVHTLAITVQGQLADEGRGGVDVLLHLVGGWRGGSSLLDQSDEDWEFLSRQAVNTLRLTSKAFYSDLVASAQGRLIMIGSTIAEHPLAKGANYAAAKAAAEAWTAAVAQGFDSDWPGYAEVDIDSDSPSSPEAGPAEGPAAVVLAVKSLLDDAQQAAHPERRFPGYTHVDTLAASALALLKTPGSVLNGTRIIQTAWDA